MVVIVEFKNHKIDICIFFIIIYKFDYWKKFYSIILLKIDKILEICFYYTIFSLYLIINLLVKSYKESLFNLQKIAQ